MTTLWRQVSGTSQLLPVSEPEPNDDSEDDIQNRVHFFLTHLNEAYNSSALHLSEYELYERTIKLITFLIC